MGRLYRIIFLLALWIPQQARAQADDCDPEQAIALATAEFDAGHFHSVSSILDKCRHKFNRDQRQRAFLLLTQTYLLLDDPIGAQRSYLDVLTANPEFIPDEQLHAIDVVYLSKRFTATPKFSWFVGGGSNVSPARVIRDVDLYEGTKEETETYHLRAGYHFGGGGEYSYNDNIKLRLEVNYLNTGYRSEATGEFANNTGAIGDRRTIIDRQSWVNVPLYVCYSDNVGTYRPYGYAGFSVSRLFSDRASIALDNLESSPSTSETIQEATTLPAESPDMDFTNRRNEFNQSLIFGGGVKYKVGLDFVFVELRYAAGLKNIVREDTRYANYGYGATTSEWIQSSSPWSQYRHMDDFLRLDNVAITIGFLRPLYKPRELRRARTKGVLRKMKRVK